MKKKNNSPDFITKDYLENTLMRLLGGIRNEIKFVTDSAVEKIKTEIHKASNINLTKLDSIVRQLEELREDKIIGAHQTKELRKQVDKHEKQIARLERTH